METKRFGIASRHILGKIRNHMMSRWDYLTCRYVWVTQGRICPAFIKNISTYHLDLILLPRIHLSFCLSEWVCLASCIWRTVHSLNNINRNNRLSDAMHTIQKKRLWHNITSENKQKQFPKCCFACLFK